MQSDNIKIKISVSEVAKTLGWPYTTADSIRKRKSPPNKYKIYLECEEKIKEAKEKINKELSKTFKIN